MRVAKLLRGGPLILAAAIVLTSAYIARADDSLLPPLASNDVNRNFIADLPNQEVDPYSGNLRILHRDIFLKGNGGLDITVNRVFDADAAWPTGNPLSFKWIGLGLGWSLNVAPKVILMTRWDLTGAASPSESWDKLCTKNAWNSTSSITYVVEHEDGRREPLIPTDTGVVVSGSNWRLTCDSSSSTYLLQSPEGTAYTLGQKHYRAPDGADMYSEGSLRLVLQATKVVDRNGNSLTITYTGLGAGNFVRQSSMNQAVDGRLAYLPASIVASDGRSLSFSYDAGVASSSTSVTGYPPRLTSITGPNGIVWQYHQVNNGLYDQLTSVVRPDGTSWGYTYSVNGPIDTISYPTGGTRAYQFEDATPYARCSINQDWDDVEGIRVHSVASSDGGTWQYSYSLGMSNGAFDVTTVTGPAGVETYKHIGVGYFTPSRFGVRDLMSPVDCTEWQPNPWMLGLLVEKDVGTDYTEVSEWSSVVLSASWPQAVLARAGMHGTQTLSPVLATKTITVNGASYVTHYSTYDQYGNATVTSESGPNGGTRTTTRAYYIDTSKWILHQLQNESFPGSSTTRTIDSNGNVLSVTDDGVAKAFTYDSQGNIATITLPRGLLHTYANYKGGIPQSETQPEGIKISRTVNDAGLVVSETNGDGYTATFSYDGLGRPTGIVPPIGNSVAISYSSNTKTATRGSLTEITTYDAFGRPIRVALGGIAHDLTYDALGRKTFESNPAPGAGSSIGAQFQYDALDRPTRTTNADGTYESISYGPATRTVIDERSNSTTYTYRSYGDPARGYLMAIAAPEPSANTTITRNSIDLITAVSQGGLTRSFGFDSRNYLTSETHPETGVTVYERDDAGNMTSRTVGSSGKTLFTYDGQNRMATITYPGATPAVVETYTKTHRLQSVQSSVANHTFTYDHNENLTGESVVSNGVTLSAGYSYNANDQLSTITYPISGRVVDYAPDVLGRPTGVSGYVSSVSYWPSGQVQEIVYSNGVVTDYAQNSRLWPAGFSTSKAGVVYVNSTYGYDGIGNLTSITDSLDAGYNRSLGYDRINRLTSAVGPWGSGSINYDGAGNILSQTFGASSLSYAYDANNRLSAVAGGRSTSYTYDVYGNLASGSGNTYQYDDAYNMTCAICGTAADRVNYAYDGLNKRASIGKFGATTYELYGSRGGLLVEYTPLAGQQLIEHIYLGPRRIAERVTVSGVATTVTPLRTRANFTPEGVTLTMSVSGAAPGGEVVFTENGVFLGAASVVNGQATIVLEGLSLGQHAIVASYTGDFNNAPSTVSYQLTVQNLSWLPAVLDLLLN